MVRVFGLLIAMSGVAAASPVRLDVTGDACTLAGLDARIADALGAQDVKASTVRIATTRDGAGVVASVVFDDGDGHVRGPRVIAAAGCDEIVEAVALVVALALPVVDVPPPPKLVEISVAPTPTSELRSQAPPPRVAPPQRSLYLEGAAGREMRAIAGVRARRGDRSLDLELGVGLPEQVAIDAVGHVTVWTSAITASPCMHRGAFAGCVTLTGGIVTGTGDGLMNARSAVSPMVSGGVRAVWEPALTSRIAARLQLDLEERVTTTHFEVDHMPVWSTERTAVRVGAGVIVHFP